MTFEFVQLPERKSPQAETGAFFAGEWRGPLPARPTRAALPPRPPAPTVSSAPPPIIPFLAEPTPVQPATAPSDPPLRVVRRPFVPADVGFVDRRAIAPARPAVPPRPGRRP